MKVLFNVNLGRNDAGRLNLDFADCVEGAEVQVTDDAAAWLEERGFAKLLDESPQKAVPAAPAKPAHAAKLKGKK